MKKKIQLIIALVSVIFIQSNSFAQKAISEGKVVYAITYPDMEMDAQMMAMMPTESLHFFKGSMSRSELSMGMGISSSSIINAKTGDIVALTDMMGTKTAMKMTSDDLQKSKSKSNGQAPVVSLTSDTKEIAGYTCKKAIVKSGEESTMEVYYTDKISSASAANLEWKEIKGFPMEYQLDQNGLKMKFTATSVSPEKVPDDKFTVPSDYKLVTQEEMMKMMGGKE